MKFMDRRDTEVVEAIQWTGNNYTEILEKLKLSYEELDLVGENKDILRIHGWDERDTLIEKGKWILKQPSYILFSEISDSIQHNYIQLEDTKNGEEKE